MAGVLAIVALSTTVAPIPVDAFGVAPIRCGSGSGLGPLTVRSSSMSSPMQPSAYLWRSSCFSVSKISQEIGSNDGDGDNDNDGETIETLQNQLVYIEALEERNKAQLDSFVDEEDQWESMEDYEKELMSSKEDLETQLNELLRLLSEAKG
jgi:hypothetical protein